MKSIYEQKCCICGCDWNHACNDHDYWFAEDLCSACAEKMKPILFNTPMVQAILDGRKTTTRRVVKFDSEHIYKVACAEGKWLESFGEVIPQKLIEWYVREIAKPPYHSGDILYVRETWGIAGFNPESNEMFVEYKADSANANIILSEEKFQKYYEGMSDAEPDWHPSIHMPKEAARIFLKVTDVRAERLQNITDKEAENEGCTDATSTAMGFFDVWDNTIKKADLPKYRWEANPWVWVISFEQCKKPEAAADA